MVMVVVMTVMVIRGVRRYRGSGEKRQTKNCKHQIPKFHGRSPLSRRPAPAPDNGQLLTTSYNPG
jgi:hypothetical protein